MSKSSDHHIDVINAEPEIHPGDICESDWYECQQCGLVFHHTDATRRHTEVERLSGRPPIRIHYYVCPQCDTTDLIHPDVNAILKEVMAR